jgi:hypothetical protein
VTLRAGRDGGEGDRREREAPGAENPHRL